jgi:hypothetical protein
MDLQNKIERKGERTGLTKQWEEAKEALEGTLC